MSPLDIERMNPAMCAAACTTETNVGATSPRTACRFPACTRRGPVTEAGGLGDRVSPGANATAIILQDDGKTLEQIVGSGRAA